MCMHIYIYTFPTSLLQPRSELQGYGEPLDRPLQFWVQGQGLGLGVFGYKVRGLERRDLGLRFRD